MMVPLSFLNTTNMIYYLKSISEEKKKQYPNIFTSLQKIAIVQSVKGSNAIEGIVTTDKRIEEIINQNSNPLNHSEQEILGYKNALNIIHTNHDLLSFNLDTIKNLHQELFEYTDLINKGKFKKEDNIIREKHFDGNSSIRFITVRAIDTEKAMEELVYAYMEARDDSDINQLLLVPCVILDFLCIHPFQDGNRRMSRLLSLLLMYKSGFDIAKYISFEEQINLYKNKYYESLRLSSINWHENKNNYLPFMENFLFTLYLCYKELDKRFLTLKDGKTNKNQRVEKILNDAFVPISKHEIISLLPDVSITTIEKVLSNMVKEGKIIKIGTTKSAKYIRK